MIDHSTVKTGRRPVDPVRFARHINARDVIDLSKPFSRPAARDWGMVDGEPLTYPMFRNDELGDCVFASLGHSQITQSANSGLEVALLDNDIVDGYRRFAGYVDGDSSTDNGASMLEVGLRLLRGEQLASRRLRIFIAVNPKDDDMVHAASEFFGGTWMGWNLPNAWKGADIWDVSSDGSTSGKWEPASWGRHATHSHSYSPIVGQLPTWTEAKPFTIPARHRYCDELYALAWDGLWDRLEGGLCPAGLDLQKLLDLSRAIGV